MIWDIEGRERVPQEKDRLVDTKIYVVPNTWLQVLPKYDSSGA